MQNQNFLAFVRDSSIATIVSIVHMTMAGDAERGDGHSSVTRDAPCTAVPFSYSEFLYALAPCIFAASCRSRTALSFHSN